MAELFAKVYLDQYPGDRAHTFNLNGSFYRLHSSKMIFHIVEVERDWN